MGVEMWQARWHAPQNPQEKRGFQRQIERATDPKKWHALARTHASPSLLDSNDQEAVQQREEG